MVRLLASEAHLRQTAKKRGAGTSVLYRLAGSRSALLLTSQCVFVRVQKRLKSSNFLVRARKAQGISATSQNAQFPRAARLARAQKRVGLDRTELCVNVKLTVVVESESLRAWCYLDQKIKQKNEP
ncbi:unnamed protein product [Ixodes pacificus]